MSDPRELAKAVVLEALRADTPAFVAMQYLGLIDQASVEEMFGDALRPEVVTVEAPPGVSRMARPPWPPPTPAHATPRRIRVMERPLIQRRPPPAMTPERQLFIDWMEKRIPDDDPRVRAMFMASLGRSD
jgi:hypothetical protein